MSKNDFIYVGSPHTPITISGSDPYSTTGLGGGARLAIWYKMDEGMYLTSSTDNSIGRKRIDTIFDSSGNDKTKSYRALNRSSMHIPLFSASSGQNLTTDVLIQDPTDATYGAIHMRTHETGSDPGSSTWNSWISGSTSGGQSKPETSIFAAMKYISDGTTAERPFTVTYGTAEDGDNGDDGKYGTFSFGMYSDASPATHTHAYPGTSHRGQSIRGLWTGFSQRDGGKSYCWGLNHNLPSTFNAISLVYGGSGSMLLETFANGKQDLAKDFSVSPFGLNHGDSPGHHGNQKMVQVGGDTHDWGAGFADGGSTTSSLGEWFAFDDALSNIRRQQMERYLCDKYDIAMSSSFYLSQFDGGPQGTILGHSSSSPDISGSHAEVFARKYKQEKGNSTTNIHYETAAGVFAKSNSNSSKVYNVTGSVSLRSWVRAENTGSSNGTAGSQIALVARATEPYGHQMDNIKGYAAKFGTFKDGIDTGKLAFRLSARDARQYTDGGTAGGYGDTDGSPRTFGVTTGSWYQMRLDVDRSGSYRNASADTYATRTANVAKFNAASACYQSGDGDTWEPLFGASSATEGAQSFSIWFKGDTLSHSYPRVFFIGNYSSEEHGINFDRGQGTIGWMARYDNRRVWWDWTGGSLTNILDDEWHNITITSKMASTWSDSTLPKLYVDGVENTNIRVRENNPQNSWSIMQFDNASWNNSELSIGADSNEGEGVYPALLCNAGIWNKILTSSEVTGIYNNGNITATEDQTTASLVGWWSLSGSGSPLVSQDATTNNNDMTAQNNVTNQSDSDLAGAFIPGLPARTDGTDTVRVWARADDDKDWEFIAENVISHSGSNAYRYVSTDATGSSPKVPAPNGKYNGYWVAMSSSDGTSTDTEYYIDNFEIITSGSYTSGMS